MVPLESEKLDQDAVEAMEGTDCKKNEVHVSNEMSQQLPSVEPEGGARPKKHTASKAAPAKRHRGKQPDKSEQPATHNNVT